MNLVYGSLSFVFWLFFLITPLAAEQFSFDVDDYDKKTVEWAGYAEGKLEHMDTNQGSAFTLLNSDKESFATMDRVRGGLQLDGRYSGNLFELKWLLKASAQQDDIGYSDVTDIYEAYGEIQPTSHVTAGLGKKSYKWGKGYAWNPVGFINRLKDPADPEEALEGYITAEVDLIKSYSTQLRTAALTLVALPVMQEINEEYGEPDRLNLAAKLYLLYRDTDIDLIFFNGNSRSNGYGVDFSKNLATNLEIHGEFAYLTDQKKNILQDDGSLVRSEDNSQVYLIGLRHLSEMDVTTIVEYYHNDGGYTEEELAHFYGFLVREYDRFLSSRDETLLARAQQIAQSGYGRPQAGRDYVYLKMSQKEPFDILYLTPGLTFIVNLADESYSLNPELSYTGFTNWEIRFRFSYLAGGPLSEFGEKTNSNRSELRVRYFF